MKETAQVFAANMASALRHYFERGGACDAVCAEMPFDALLAREDDGSGEAADEERMAQRRAAVRALFGYLTAEGPQPLKIMKRLFAVGRGLRLPFFSALTMGEAALMFSETKAAHSWRVKVLSGMIKLQGMKGYRLSGQKTPEAREHYAAAQAGNRNRARKAGKGSHEGTKARREEGNGTHGTDGTNGRKKRFLQRENNQQKNKTTKENK